MCGRPGDGCWVPCRVAPAAGFALVRVCEMHVKLSECSCVQFQAAFPSIFWTSMFARHLVVVSGDIGYCTYIPVQPGITLGETSNRAEVPWNNSKLKILNQDRRRNKTIQGRVKTSSHFEGSVDAGGNGEQNPASFLPVCFLPYPCNEKKRRGLSDKKENAFVQNSLWTCSFVRLLSEII